jgi:hypothetical protein
MRFKFGWLRTDRGLFIDGMCSPDFGDLKQGFANRLVRARLGPSRAFPGVSDQQGRSGLELEAQRKAVTDHLNGGAWELVGEFVEVESGKKSDRPELARAMEACRKHKARLVIAKLDRLSRNLAFVATLMESGGRVRRGGHAFRQ